MKNHQALFLLPILALAFLLITIGESGSLRPVLSGPDRAYLNTRVVFRCSVPNLSSMVSYMLIRDRRFVVGRNVGRQRKNTAMFPLKVNAASDGSYHCKASTEESQGLSNRIKLTVVTPPSNIRVTSDPYPPVAFEGSQIVLSCDAQRGSHLNYTWYFNRTTIMSSTSGFSIVGNKLVMEKVTLEREGNYNCIAWSMVQQITRYSTSTEVKVTVKVKISKPEISLFIFKEGDTYLGNVTCWSSKGTPPVNFSLLLDDTEVITATAAKSLAAWFKIPVAIGLNMGEARCRGRNEAQDLKSEALTLEVGEVHIEGVCFFVTHTLGFLFQLNALLYSISILFQVPVGGDVRLEVDYLYTAEAKLDAVKLSCHISRGTFPHFSWLVNNTILPTESQKDFKPQTFLSHQKQGLILSEFSAEYAGYYRCRARDSYEDSGPWAESAAVLVQITEENLNSMAQASSCTSTMSQKLFSDVITIVFCCFFLLMLAVASVCVYKMFDQPQAFTNVSATK
ncbi:PREDICTED: Fc receptor-like protein 5 [Cyprinodon variegatus]|uniref:Fc receptor-like protein 5 n=1 Tax=Cyprinodon variegatus TaxID=28743 RepID=UPI0007427914|nr:PREDICTED: Fc receptor-like protein 5 [Cyprinodon variegatus]